MRYPDGEDAVADLLAEAIPALGVYFRTPDFSIDDPGDYEANVPFVVISRLDGASNDQGWERTEVIEIQQFSKTRAEAKALSATIDVVLARPEGVGTPAGFFDKIVPAALPNQVPYDQEDVRRDVSTWALASRLQELEAES